MKKTKYLIDTNILITFLRENRNIANKLIKIGSKQLCYISILKSAAIF